MGYSSKTSMKLMTHSYKNYPLKFVMMGQLTHLKSSQKLSLHLEISTQQPRGTNIKVLVLDMIYLIQLLPISFIAVSVICLSLF